MVREQPVVDSVGAGGSEQAVEVAECTALVAVAARVDLEAVARVVMAARALAPMEQPTQVVAVVAVAVLQTAAVVVQAS